MNVNMQVSKQMDGYLCISVQDFGSRHSVCASVSLSKFRSVTLLVCPSVSFSAHPYTNINGMSYILLCKVLFLFTCVCTEKIYNLY